MAILVAYNYYCTFPKPRVPEVGCFLFEIIFILWFPFVVVHYITNNCGGNLKEKRKKKGFKFLKIIHGLGGLGISQSHINNIQLNQQ
jgi:ABC-type amino acid transport system permease subunit